MSNRKHLPVHIATVRTPGQHDVTLQQYSANAFVVVYGTRIQDGLSYTRAAVVFGECVLHAAACAGKLSEF